MKKKHVKVLYEVDKRGITVIIAGDNSEVKEAIKTLIERAAGIEEVSVEEYIQDFKI